MPNQHNASRFTLHRRYLPSGKPLFTVTWENDVIRHEETNAWAFEGQQAQEFETLEAALIWGQSLIETEG